MPPPPPLVFQRAYRAVVLPMLVSSSPQALTLDEVFEKVMVPTVRTELAPLWPGRFCFESRESGVGSVPRSDGWGQRPDRAASASSRSFHGAASGLGRVGSLLWPHFSRPLPVTTPPELLPCFFSGHHGGQGPPSPPESISHCCPHTSICSAFRVTLLRGDRGMGAPSRSCPAVTVSCIHPCCACAS